MGAAEPRRATPSTICRVTIPQPIAHAVRAVGVALLVPLLMGGCSSSSGEPAADPLASLKTWHQIPDRPLDPPPATVAQADGGSWSYAHPSGDGITLLYFGYTSCPDVCPTTMSDIAVALSRLPQALRDKVSVQFVSTDPHRDTPARLRHWVEAYSPSFHAGRAPIGQVIESARAYGISISPPKVTKGDYQVTHGAQVLVLNRDGGEVGFFTELAGARAYDAALPTLIRRYA